MVSQYSASPTARCTKVRSLSGPATVCSTAEHPEDPVHLLAFDFAPDSCSRADPLHRQSFIKAGVVGVWFGMLSCPQCKLAMQYPRTSARSRSSDFFLICSICRDIATVLSVILSSEGEEAYLKQARCQFLMENSDKVGNA